MSPFVVRCLSAFVFATIPLSSGWAEEASATTYYIQLVRATNEKTPVQNCKAIGPKLRKKLSPVFQWSHYWEMSRKEASLATGKITKLLLMPDQNLEIELIGDKSMELRLYRNGVLARKTRYDRNGMAIMGGDSANHEAWFVVVRSEKPTNEES